MTRASIRGICLLIVVLAAAPAAAVAQQRVLTTPRPKPAAKPAVPPAVTPEPATATPSTAKPVVSTAKPAARTAKPATSTVKPAATTAKPADKPAVTSVVAPVTAPAGAPVVARPAAAPVVAGVSTPGDYVIGPEDVLGVMFWRDEAMSGDTVVRPDGKITLRLLNDIVAAGLTPDELRVSLMTAASKFLEDPSVTVVVKTLNSRKIMVMGEVNKQGPISLNGPMTVLVAIGMAGGLTEFADGERITILRTENGVQKVLPFDYKAIVKDRKKLELNILLKPGDSVLVP